MPLAPDVRRKDKEMLLPERIPKFYISEDMVSKVSKRFPNVKIMKHNGKFYVDIREFNSVSWLRLEREKPTRQMYAYTILKFCQFKDSFPDDLIEDYKVDKSKVIADFKSFLAI